MPEERGKRGETLCRRSGREHRYRAGGFSGLVLWMWLGLVVSPSECCQERLRAAAARRGHRQPRDHARDLAQGCMPRRRAASADQAQPQEVLACWLQAEHRLFVAVGLLHSRSATRKTRTRCLRARRRLSTAPAPLPIPATAVYSLTTWVRTCVLFLAPSLNA
jgi:hypothetical protein